VKISMVPAVLRRDPGIQARPELWRDSWWSGAPWDPRSPASPSNASLGRTSAAYALAELPSSGEGQLVAAAIAGNHAAVAQRLASGGGAGATRALHEALRAAVDPEVIQLLAAKCCKDLDAWLPEPAVVTWARCAYEHGWPTSSKDGTRSQRRARRCGMEHLDVLLAAGAYINAVGKGCESALHILAERVQASGEDKSQGLLGAWHQLVARGADASVLDSDGRSPLERLSPGKCRAVLAAKRLHYGAQHLLETRLRAGASGVAAAPLVRMAAATPRAPAESATARGCSGRHSGPATPRAMLRGCGGLRSGSATPRRSVASHSTVSTPRPARYTPPPRPLSARGPRLPADARLAFGC